MKFINGDLLLRKAEHCIETTDAFKDLIKEMPEMKYFYRITIFRKDGNGSMAVAHFMDKEIADGFIRNIVKTNPDWDEDKLTVRAVPCRVPPWTNDDNAISNKIKHLLNRD